MADMEKMDGVKLSAQHNADQSKPEDESLSLKPLIDRYYTRYYRCDVDGRPGADQFVFEHFNALLVVGVSRYHPLVVDPSPIESIDFKADGEQDRLQNEVTGKKKHGAQTITPESLLCRVKLVNGKTYDILGIVKGSLVQANACLMDNLQMLKNKPETDGWVAIITRKNKSDKLPTNLENLESYEKLRGTT
ncbi:hypothetical protein SARC_11192 [Sphaeroforma arctica JP610]|uniref:Actin-binding transcription modulator n=1 Tax=Sphaeroforma arctica JP610 TaxID=667725 RepID=A0A0L0FHP3_9EUKA|nr:hypothetical protein SARC_11192 [Sphaeroforma arctica JP610]KNC76299.1 hypothetical protein SARC_11192 [Sphaeroforma arctica JP610]|eukprot:XP_014150201.1 hypothetical protein SARC_11192 [Sphaeroforma arctica JP610]